jgi:hypothetical protein
VVKNQAPEITALIERAKANADPSHRAFVSKLSKDVERLMAEEGEGASPIARYILVGRLIVLTALAGEVAHVNCRSGKDRTGLADVEAKFALYQLYRMGQGLPISQVGGTILPEERDGWRAILLEGGNHEIQYLNSGYRGSKVDQLLLRERIGTELWDAFVFESRKSRA